MRSSVAVRFRNLLRYYAENDKVKGEIVLVIGPPEERQVDEADVDAILSNLAASMPTAKAAAEAARLTGLPRKELYQRLLDMKVKDER